MFSKALKCEATASGVRPPDRRLPVQIQLAGVRGLVTYCLSNTWQVFDLGRAHILVLEGGPLLSDVLAELVSSLSFSSSVLLSSLELSDATIYEP